MKTLNMILVAIGFILIVGGIFVIAYMPSNFFLIALGVWIVGMMLAFIGATTGKTK